MNQFNWKVLLGMGISKKSWSKVDFYAYLLLWRLRNFVLVYNRKCRSLGFPVYIFSVELLDYLPHLLLFKSLAYLTVNVHFCQKIFFLRSEVLFEVVSILRLFLFAHALIIEAIFKHFISILIVLCPCVAVIYFI